MASANLILKVTPAEVETKAGEIGSCRDQMQSLMEEMVQLVQRLSTSWSSTAGDAYVERYQVLKQEINDSLLNLQTHVDHLKQAAQTYDQMEGEIGNKVTSLDSGNIF
ncbi:MAG: WXG100 family type VII secretion target [Ruminiclostridium sp.]|nr:WXG100 family type VII secretion target [Ruminiclostridium sp.]